MWYLLIFVLLFMQNKNSSLGYGFRPFKPYGHPQGSPVSNPLKPDFYIDDPIIVGYDKDSGVPIYENQV